MDGSGSGRSRRALAAVLSAAVLAGCYTYVPVEPAAVPPGSDVRIRADRSFPAEGSSIQPNGGGVIRGRLVESFSPDTLLFSVALMPEATDVASRGLRSVLAIPTSAVTGVEMRRLSRGRTGLVVGASTVLAAALLDAAFDIRPGREGSDDGGGIDEAVIPLLRIRF